MGKVIITGPTGAIGTALIRECESHGLSVTAVCRRGSGRRGYLDSDKELRLIECNLDELDRLPELTGESGFDAFFHLAWDGTFGSERDQMYAQADNIGYTLDAVCAANALGCRRFIGVGSQAEYGRTDQKLAPDTPVKPETGYGMAKLCAGQMSRELCEQLGMEHIWARVLSVYGPCDREQTMIMYVIRELLAGREPELTEGGQYWDYLYSEDAARALFLLSQSGIPGSIYPIGSGSARPLDEYIRILRDCIDPALPLGFGKREYAPRQVMYLCADLTALWKDTGFLPRYSFEEGIRRTISWCRRMN